MTKVLPYDCPPCTTTRLVSPNLVGRKVVCPSCGHEFTATPPRYSDDIHLPGAISLFKSGKL